MNPRRILLTSGRVLRQIANDPVTGVLLVLVPTGLVGLVAWMFADTNEYQDIGPSLIAMFPFTSMFLIAAVSTLRERINGTLPRILATSLTKLEFMLGYVLAFAVLATVQAGVAVGFSMWVCGLTIEGSAEIVFLVALADAILGTAVGLLASSLVRTEFQVMQMVSVVIAPQVLLGGVLVPRELLPQPLESIANMLPLSQAVDLVDDAATRVSDLAGVLPGILQVLVIAGGVTAVGTLLLRRQSV